MPLGKDVGLGPGHIVLDRDPVGTQVPPQQPLHTFRPMSIVAIRSPISATAELVFIFEVCSFTHSEDTTGGIKCKQLHVVLTTPLSGVVCRP